MIYTIFFLIYFNFSEIYHEFEIIFFINFLISGSIWVYVHHIYLRKQKIYKNFMIYVVKLIGILLTYKGLKIISSNSLAKILFVIANLIFDLNQKRIMDFIYELRF